MRILIDMDGTIADFEQAFLNKWREHHPDKPFIPIEERITFYIKDQYPKEYKSHVASIYLTPNFYRSLSPIAGSIEAMKDIREMGHDVFICSSPLSDYKNCVLEKYQWVEEHLGSDWINRLILTKDKTIISGDVLIDDKPIIEGSQTQTWEHIIYDQPYNQSVSNKRRLTWKTWQDVLFSFSV